MANLRRNPALEINVVDPILRKGYSFKGRARIVTEGPLFEEILAFYRREGLGEYAIQAVVLVKVERALPLISPAYDLGATEEQLRAHWTERWKSLYEREARV